MKQVKMFSVLFCKCQWKMSTLNHSTMFVCVLCCFTHEVFLSVYFSLRGSALLIRLCTIFWQVLNLCEQKMVLIYDVSNYCSESRPFRLHSAFNLTEFKWHKMPFSWALAGILYISFQWKTFTCKYGLFGVRTNATIMTDEGFWSQFYKLKPWKRGGYLDRHLQAHELFSSHYS